MTRRGWTLFAVMCVAWGIPYLLIKVAVRDLTPASLVLARTTIGAALLLPVALARGEVKPLLRYWKPFLCYTTIEIAIPWLLLSSAEEHLPSSLAGLLIAAVPLVGALIAFGTRGEERLSRTQYLGLIVGLGGVAALVGLDIGGSSWSSYLEIGVVVVCYALGPWIIVRYLGDAPRLGVVAVSLAIVALGYAPVGAIELPSRVPPGAVIAAVVGLGVACTAVAFLVFFALIAEIGAVRSTVITYVNPAVAVLLGVTILGERLTSGTVLGSVLILAGSFLATRARPAPPGIDMTAPEVAVERPTEPELRAAAAVTDPRAIAD